MKIPISLPCFVLLLLSGCQKHISTQPNMNTEQERNPTVLDACSLITKEEIQTIQGSRVTDTKSSESSQGAFHVSQCFFSAAESNKSVSLAVTQSGGPGKQSPKDFWKVTFGRYEGGQKEHEGDKEKRENLRDQRRGKEEAHEATPPKKINGIGDDAYWAANPVGGALYVLKQEAFIRISVGGPDNEETKINKSKALAQKAIERL
jgi:hypothetical protein